VIRKGATGSLRFDPAAPTWSGSKEDQQMQVNVFVARHDGELGNEYLVLPMDPKAPIPKKYRTGWQYIAITSTTDHLFGDVDAVAIETEIKASGFAVVHPAPDRH
jgi:hypothetical protein